MGNIDHQDEKKVKELLKDQAHPPFRQAGEMK
jgi:hypothetical protein